MKSELPQGVTETPKFRVWDAVNGFWVDTDNWIITLDMRGNIILWHQTESVERLDFSGPYTVALWEKIVFKPDGRYKFIPLQEGGPQHKEGEAGSGASG